MKSTIKFADIDWSSGTPKSIQFNDIYYSEAGGRDETIHNFLNGNNILQRLPLLEAGTEFIIAETGFGTGSNLWILLENISKTLVKQDLNLTFVSFEKFPLSSEDLSHFLNSNFKDLNSIVDLNLFLNKYSALNVGLNEFSINSRVKLKLWIGDALYYMDNFVKQHNGMVDAWFLDGFAPSKNSDLWNSQLFQSMYKATKQFGTLATFTVAGTVRRGLRDAGFTVQKIPGTGQKKEILIGIKNIPTHCSS